MHLNQLTQVSVETDHKQTYKFCQDTPLHISNNTAVMVQNFRLNLKNKTHMEFALLHHILDYQIWSSLMFMQVT
jgi:hypothetical protein